MRLTRIRLRDWMPFPDVDLDLTGVDSVVVVGENGSGKSSIIDAITWAIYDRTRQPGGGEGSSPDKLIREGADSTLVNLEWEAGGHQVAVTRERFRGREGKLRLTVDGAETSHHTMADTRAAIIRHAGLAFAPALAGPIMVQAGLYPDTVADSLMRAGPGARKDILLEVVGGTEWAPVHEYAKLQRDEQRALAAAYDRRVGELTEQSRGRDEVVVQLDAAKDRVAEAEKQVAKLDVQIMYTRERAAALAERASRLATLRTSVTTLTTAIEGDQQGIERHKRSIVAARGAQGAAEPVVELADVTALEGAVTAASAASRASASRRTDAVLVGREIDTARNAIARYERTESQYSDAVATVPCHAEGIYASCRFLTDKPDAAEAEVARAALPALEARFAELEVPDVDHDTALAEAQTTLRTAEINNERQQAAHREWAQRREQATEVITTAEAEIARISKRIAGDTERLSDDVTERDQLTAEIGETENIGREQARLAAARASALGAKGEAERPVARLEAQLIVIDRAAEHLVAATEQVREATSRADTFGILADASHRDGIPTMLIENALPPLERAANEILERLPGDLQLSLVSGRTTAAGTVSDRLDITVSDTGFERDHVMLSIGQRLRVDVALRMAINRVRGSMRTLILDEPFANLDARARQALVETLNLVAPEFGLVMVVSHSEDVNDAFGRRIAVAREGATSTAALV